MSEPDSAGLEERVARLERLVEALVARGAPPVRPPELEAQPTRPVAPRAARSSAGPAPPPPAAGSGSPSAAPSGSPTTAPSPLAGRSEQWLGRVGIAFVVLAFAFLLKLSFDRGWITPALRLASGFGAGAALLLIGLRLEPARRRLAQVLLGGAVALFYLVGFAGFQLYGLLPFWVALSLMTTTTVLSIALSDRQDHPLLAVIGVAGGLATPFLLSTGSNDMGALAAYASLVLLGGGAVQLHRGWMSLLLTLLVGGSAVVAVLGLGSGVDAIALRIAAMAAFWMVCAWSPIVRPVVGHPPRGRNPESVLWISRLTGTWTTALTVVVIASVLGLDRAGVGLLLVGFGVLTGATAYLGRAVPLTAKPAAEIAALCIAFALWLITWDSTAMLLILVEVAALFVLVGRGAPASLAALGHVLAAMVAVAFVLDAQQATPDALLGLREGAVTRLGVLGMAVVLALWAGREGPLYKGAAYVGLLVWLVSELAIQPNGPALVSIAWAVQGTAALVAALRVGSRPLQVAGLGTLGLVAGKLLLVDLAQLDPVWRILLFLGFGATLLMLGYLVNRPAAPES
jgi:uncharacterized membrane protein